MKFLSRKNERIEKLFQDGAGLMGNGLHSELEYDLSLALYQVGFCVKHDLSLSEDYCNKGAQAREFLATHNWLTERMETAVQAGRKLSVLFRQSSGDARNDEVFRTKAAAYKFEIKDFMDAVRGLRRYDLFPLSSDATNNEYRLVMGNLDKVIPTAAPSF